jgi:hypothetical protein
MKIFIKVSLMFVLLIGIVELANSQGLLKNIKNKTQEKIEQKVEERALQRADKEIDKQLDKQLDKAEEAIFNDEENETYNEEGESYNRHEKRMTDMIRKMGVGGEPVPIQGSYSFNTLIQMHIESENKNGEKTSEGEFITHLSPESGILAYEFVSGDMAESDLGLIIIDAKNSATIILSEENGKKTGLVYGLGTFWNDVQEESMEDLDFSETPETYLANPNISKTGRTKTIAGYPCEEYKYSDETSDSNIWITRDLNMNSKDFFSMLFKTSLYSHGMGWGYMMEATTVNKENGEKSTMLITDVNKNSNKKVLMNNYEITNLGSFTSPEDK